MGSKQLRVTPPACTHLSLSLSPVIFSIHPSLSLSVPLQRFRRCQSNADTVIHNCYDYRRAMPLTLAVEICIIGLHPMLERAEQGIPRVIVKESITLEKGGLLILSPRANFIIVPAIQIQP